MGTACYLRVSLYLVRIIHACLATGYVPGIWRQVKVVFVPKPGRSYYTGTISPT